MMLGLSIVLGVLARFSKSSTPSAKDSGLETQTNRST